jgi:hypothetical protein
MNTPLTDGRIPVLFGTTPGPTDALLREGKGAAAPGVEWFTPAPAGHAAGCACCTARAPAGQALGRLALARARGEAPFFLRVVAHVASQAGRQAVLQALAADPVAAARFRLLEM